MLVRHSTKQSLAVPVSLCSVEEPVGAYQAPSGLECATDRFGMVSSVPQTNEVVGDSWSSLSGLVEVINHHYPLYLPSLLLAAVIGGYKWSDTPIGVAGDVRARQSHVQRKPRRAFRKGLSVLRHGRKPVKHTKKTQTGIPSPLTDLQRDETKSGQPRKRGLRLAKAK